MNAVFTVVACAGVVIAFDWAGVGRMASMATSFDYRYWPPSRLRIGSVMFLAAGSIIGLFWPTAHSIGPLKWSDVLFFLTVAVWSFVLWFDFLRQQRTAYSKRPERD